MSMSLYTQNANLFDKENAGKFVLRYNCVDNNFLVTIDVIFMSFVFCNNLVKCFQVSVYLCSE